MKKTKKKKPQPRGGTFGERLEMALNTQGISSYKLEATTTANKTMIRRYLSNKSIPGLQRTDELAIALGVSFSWLGKGEGSMLSTGTEPSNLLEDESLRNMRTDLFTVCKIVEKVEEKHRKRGKKLSPKQISNSVALLCMRVLQADHNTDDEAVVRFVEGVDNSMKDDQD